MKSLIVISILGVVACGRSNENGNLASLGSTQTKAGKEPIRSESEDGLGILSIDSAYMGRYYTGFGVGKLPPKNADLAFGNVVSFTVPSTSNLCTGAFAYEAIPSNSTMVNLYFYSATHCFEKRNALGVTILKLSKNSIGFGSGSTRPVRFTSPYSPTNLTTADVVSGKSDVIYEGSIRGDIVRTFQAQITLADAQKKYLPSCASFDATSRKDLTVGGMVIDLTGVVQANSSRDVKLAGLGIPVTDQFVIPNSGIGTTLRLEQVSSIPGESGAPVWLIDAKQKWQEMNEYLCHQGVVSREVISAKLGGDGKYTLSADTYFSPAMRPSSTVTWVPIY